MPNWCYCELSIVGSIEERIKFKSFAEGSGLMLDFNRFILYPERFRVMDEKCEKMRASGVPWEEIPKDGFNNGGYEWCIANWGTKWNASCDDVKEKSRSLVYRFDTAWDPPRPVIYLMAEMFPRLRFNLWFWEGGSGFQGQLMIRSHVVLKNMRGDYRGCRGG